MGGSSSTTTSKQAEQATTVPQTPTYASDPVKNYMGGIENYQAQDPYAMVTPINSLQQGAFNNAGGLFQSSGMYGQAAQGAKNVMNATPTTYTAGFNGAQTNLLGNAAQTSAQGYQAPNLGQAAQVQSPTLGQAAQTTAQGYQAPNLGNAAQASSSGYQAANLGNAAQAGVTGYQAPNLGNAAQANLGGYQTANLGNAAQAAGGNLGGQATQATSASLLDNLQAYQNPALAALRDTTLSSMDANADKVRAQQAAQFARSGAFGGSRAGIAQGATEGELARERGLAEANLNSQAWTAATNLSGQDAANRQQTSLFNANAQNQRDETGAGLAQANNQFNTGQANQFDLSRFGAQNDANAFGANAANTGALANQAATNQFSLAGAQMAADAGQFNANAQNSASQFNTGQANQFGLAQGQMQNAANEFGASAANTANLANAQSQNQYGLAQGQMAADAAQFGANAQNAAGQFNAGQQNQFSLAGADMQQQANLANMGAQNQFGLAQGQMQNDAAQFGANAQNQANLANAGAQNQFSLANQSAQNQGNQFNAAAANQNQQFNSSAMNDAQQQQLARQLQASGLLGDIAGQSAGDYRADLGMQSDLGNSLWSLQNNYQNAPLTQLQNVGGLLNPGYIQALSGQTVTGTTNGTSQQKQSGGLFNSILGAASVAAPFISDRRAKTNIEKIGVISEGRGKGLGWYKWDYVWGEPSEGVMVDEVEALAPWALGPIIGGYKSVRYGAL